MSCLMSHTWPKPTIYSSCNGVNVDVISNEYFGRFVRNFVRISEALTVGLATHTKFEFRTDFEAAWFVVQDS
jgi:hypothetical protein